ncbi:HK97 family phage prohead protease [Mucilaginibacter sp. SMC90]|uniref:HK97 family phage prohead protease n=1 Tax=Mucilaginibacter sp. SMC90 TaxID=2929803 RepID=UPI001FB25D4C|nr:HK97 family phage prohead protease [Mucilaginibacter sp. SMC90]UOE47987.1 HK97 family phage prohead protease [Mucilaginibacter sp. SMC90]
MKRTTKRYVITTSGLNCYKYRVMSDGGDWVQYLKNPILLWMHQRAFSNDKSQILPPGCAVEIELHGDEWSCYLEFDENDPFAMQLYNKYEAGILNMVSLGAIPLEWTEDPSMMLPGQTGPTITKWKVTDISCVDIGGNDDACACQLYGHDEKRIELSGLDKEGFIKLFNSLQQIKNDDNDNMKLIQLTGAALNGILLSLKLDETATEVQVQKAVADMIQLNASQATDINTLKADKKDLQDEVTQLKADQNEANVIKLADDNKNKYLPGQREKYIRLARVDFDGTKELLEGMPVLESVADKLTSGNENGDKEVKELIKLSYDELWKTGQLERLQKLDNQAYLDKRAEKFPVKSDKK